VVSSGLKSLLNIASIQGDFKTQKLAENLKIERDSARFPNKIAILKSSLNLVSLTGALHGYTMHKNV
jgi:hypothetical protein